MAVKHPYLSLPWTDDDFQDYIKNKMTEEEFLNALEGKYKLYNDFALGDIADNEKFNNADVLDKINIEKFLNNLKKREIEHFPLNLHESTLKKIISSEKYKNNKILHSVIGDNFKPGLHNDPKLTDIFLKQGDKKSFLESLKNIPEDNLPKYHKQIFDIIDNNEKLIKVIPDKAAESALKTLPEEKLIEKVTNSKNFSLFKKLPEHLKEKVTNNWLGITGGEHISDDDAQNPDSNYQNWSRGPHFSDLMSNELVKGRHKLTDAQAEHIMRHGSFENKFNMFHKGDINPEIKKKMYELWNNNYYEGGYDENEYKEKHAEIKEENIHEDDDLTSRARELAEDNYSFGDFLRDVDWQLYDKVSDKKGEEAAKQAIIDEHFDKEDDAWITYDESLSDAEDEYLQKLAHEKYHENALYDYENLPRDLVNHPSFQPYIEERRAKKEKASVQEAINKEWDQRYFHNERIPNRKNVQQYASGQHYYKIAQVAAKHKGGSIDLGTMISNRPELKEIWKNIFGDKSKLSTDEIQQKIDALPKRKYRISYDKWSSHQAQNLNKQDQTIFKLDHSLENLQQLKDQGLYSIFSKISDLSERSGHPTNINTIGWARVDTTNPKHWIIDEIQSDFSPTVRKFLQDNDKNEEAGQIDKLLQFHGKWHEPLIHHIIKTAKANGVEKISTHTPESKARSTDAGKVHSMYKDSYQKALKPFNFKKVLSSEVPLTESGKSALKLDESPVNMQTLDLTALKPKKIKKSFNFFNSAKLLKKTLDKLQKEGPGRIAPKALEPKFTRPEQEVAQLTLEQIPTSSQQYKYTKLGEDSPVLGEGTEGILIPSEQAGKRGFQSFAASIAGRRDTQEHEGHHVLVDKLINKYGIDKINKMYNDLINKMHPAVKNFIGSALLATPNYARMANHLNPRYKLAFKEEMINMLRDSVHGSLREDLVKFLHAKPYVLRPHFQDFNHFDRELKRNWKTIRDHANQMKPEDL